MKKHKKARLLTMDELHSRPCEVDGCPAFFLRWVEEYTTEGYVLRALVEYRGGMIDKVEPERIRFTGKEGRDNEA